MQIWQQAWGGQITDLSYEVRDQQPWCNDATVLVLRFVSDGAAHPTIPDSHLLVLRPLCGLQMIHKADWLLSKLEVRVCHTPHW